MNNEQRTTNNALSWPEIWGKKGAGVATEEILTGLTFEQAILKLKEFDGFEFFGSTLSFETFYRQYTQIKNEISFNNIKTHEIKSVFEIGCGSGATLYMFEHDGIKTGGIDYSEQLLRIAKTVLNDKIEIIHGEALDTPTAIKYDSVISNSVFQYFPDHDYALRVLELMYEKSNYSIGITDVHDINKKEAFEKYRRETVKDYETRYKGLGRLFCSKDFFIKFAEKHKLNIRFTYSDMAGYWNNEFIYNVFMTR